MAAVESGPQRILAILLGAGRYEVAPTLAQGASFANSGRDFHNYLKTVLRLPEQNVKWLFDDPRYMAEQLVDVGNFLDERSRDLKAAGAPPTDLIVYYIGHGMFCGLDRAYHLAIRATEAAREGLTSIRVSELAQTLKDHGRFLRKFLILDCCFAGAAYQEFLSSPLEVSRTQLVNELPGRGTALLCAASAKEAAIAPQGLARTMFSDSLLKSLEAGHPGLGSRMSLSDLGTLVRQHIKDTFPESWVRPEVHSPDQKEGDVADVALFPNPAAARQEALLLAETNRAEEERRRKETEQQLARKQAELERTEREIEETRRKAQDDRRTEEARLAKAREELERIHKAAQEREAAAIRKAEEDRKAELARLQLAAREAQRRADQLRRGEEDAARRKAEERLRAQKESEERRRASEDANRRKAEEEARAAERAARDDEIARRFAADQERRERRKAQIGLIAIVAIIASIMGVRYWNSGSHKHPAETSVASKPNPVPTEPHVVAPDNSERPSVNNDPVTPKPGSSFRDCPEPECPEMIKILAGSFVMGSPSGERGQLDREGPTHDVRLPAFSLGKYDVTFDEWDACVAAGGCKTRPSDQGWGRGSRPVINVSWNDAQEYVRWLSQKARHTYRLPSEAEWEYAARANTTTPYYWGDEIGRGNANCDGCGSRWDDKQTAPVGRFEPNPWGLFDMAGNVWQWVQDCDHDNYQHAPADGSAWTTACAPRRVIRGGSWFEAPVSLRSTHRAWSLAGRGDALGFRVARAD